MHGRAIGSGFKKGQHVRDPSVECIFDIGAELAKDYGAEVYNYITVNSDAIDL